jgi:hypothetical protein
MSRDIRKARRKPQSGKRQYFVFEDNPDLAFYIKTKLTPYTWIYHFTATNDKIHFHHLGTDWAADQSSTINIGVPITNKQHTKFQFHEKDSKRLREEYGNYGEYYPHGKPLEDNGAVYKKS